MNPLTDDSLSESERRKILKERLHQKVDPGALQLTHERPDIPDVAECVVGEHYDVLCARIVDRELGICTSKHVVHSFLNDWHWSFKRHQKNTLTLIAPYRKGWLPVLGPVHRDNDLDFPYLHIHVDYRFVRVNPNIKNISAFLAYPLAIELGFEEQRCFEFEVQRLRCHRTQVEWPHMSRRLLSGLEDSMFGHRAVNGVCPHRGVPLSVGCKLANGNTQCAAHSLIWSPEGELVPQIKEFVSFDYAPRDL